MTYFTASFNSCNYSGAVGKVIYDKVLDDRKSKEVLENIEVFIKNLKGHIKRKIKQRL